jgi:hypothetical protein
LAQILSVFVGIQKAPIEGDTIDVDYLRTHPDNCQEIVDRANGMDGEDITITCGIDRSEIIAVAAKVDSRSGTPDI